MNKDWLEQKIREFVPEGVKLSLWCRQLPDGTAISYHDRLLPSASLIKLPIMSAAFRAREMGSLDFSSSCVVTDPVEGGSFYERGGDVVSVADLVFHMIVESDNTCANMLMERLGMAAVNAECQRLGLTRTVLRRRMMDFQAARQGKENMTTAADMGRFFTLLAQGRVVSIAADQAMRDILCQQEDNPILPAQLPHQLPVAHKTGELDGIYHDCGIIYGANGPIVLCLLASEVESEPELFYGLSYLTRALYDKLLSRYE